ncbi:hypothetical protein E2C01_070150 [Portunus trituberculatus]|uniref:Uncharacterized protein n=1 Tax=Portunus trituberculatus TaxID=210409 RepID=A0A5B7I2S1_PORTR|nr:hypothetical protein [Portunus trituberculatus]
MPGVPRGCWAGHASAAGAAETTCSGTRMANTHLPRTCPAPARALPVEELRTC